MNTMQASDAHHINSEPHPGFFPNMNHEGGHNLLPEPGPSDRFTTHIFMSLTDAGSGGGTGTGGTGTGGTGTGGTGTGGTGTGGTGTGGTGTGAGGTNIHHAGSGTGVGTEHPSTSGSGTTGTGAGSGTGTGGTATGGSGATGTGTTRSVGSGTGTGNDTGGIRMATHRLASLKLKRRNQFRGMRDRVTAGARSLIGNVQGFVGLSVNQQSVSRFARRDSHYVSDTLEFDGLGIS